MPGGIEIKTRDEIAYMREASMIVYEVLDELTRAVAPGVTLEELDSIAERETVRRGGICAFKGLYGFPKNICISVNEQVVHGIPTRRKLVEGDLLKLDFGVIKHGWYGDSARTVPVGKVPADVRKLIDVTRDSLEKGIQAVAGDVDELAHVRRDLAHGNGARRVAVPAVLDDAEVELEQIPFHQLPPRRNAVDDLLVHRD